MKKIAIVTATRAEYGLLSPIIREMRKSEDESLKTELIVTGTHLSDRYGKTVSEIEMDGMRIDHVIPISVDSDSPMDISKNQSEVLIKFTELFQRENYDGLVLLGDRYETLCIAIAAENTHIPIFHISGGDISEGAIDDSIRHCITKMSCVHFPTNEDSRRRVIQLGEAPDRVFNYGSTSVDNILSCATMTKAEVLHSINLPECRYALCTYHPVTMGSKPVEELIEELITAIRHFPNISFIVTKSNADQGGQQINDILDREEPGVSNLHMFSSLGARYLPLMKHAEFVIGNSSSGIIEAPILQIPSVNIGERQRGRYRVGSIIDCGDTSDKIIAAIDIALSPEFKEKCKDVKSPYGDGHSAERISTKILEMIRKDMMLGKSFYDVDYAYQVSE